MFKGIHLRKGNADSGVALHTLWIFLLIDRLEFVFNAFPFFYERVGASGRTNSGYESAHVQSHGSELNRRVYG